MGSKYAVVLEFLPASQITNRIRESVSVNDSAVFQEPFSGNRFPILDPSRCVVELRIPRLFL